MFESQQVKSGVHYFIIGCQLINQKGLRRFVIMPILLNIFLMLMLLWVFIGQVNAMIDWTMSFLPAWLDWLSSLMFIMALLMILVLFYFSFTMLSGFIAAPFNGLLAEKVEMLLTGEPLANVSMRDFIVDIPRMLKREWQKLIYSLPIYFALFLLGFTPVIGQTVIPIVGFVFAAWMMAIQYCDYPFDNHKVPFSVMRMQLKAQATQSLTFGSLVLLCTLTPIINLVVIPIAVCGATAMWVDNYRLLNAQDINKTRSENTALFGKQKTDNFPI